MFGDGENPAEQIYLSVRVAATHEDHDAGLWGTQVEIEAPVSCHRTVPAKGRMVSGTMLCRLEEQLRPRR